MPTLLLLAATLSWIGLALAIDLSIVVSPAARFGFGAQQTRRVGAPPSRQLAIGLVGGVLGLIIVVAEVALAH